MAEKKKTTQKKKTAQKKTTSSKKIKLTYNPIGFSAPVINFFLRTKDDKGRSKPLIKGIPTKLTVTKGEIIEVTKKQYEELQAEGCVETEEEYEQRKNFLKNMGDQYPQTFSDLEIAEKNGQLISAQEKQRMIYNDKLIRCD